MVLGYGPHCIMLKQQKNDPEVSLALVVACLGLFSHFAISNLLSKAEALRDGEAVTRLGSTHTSIVMLGI